MADVQNNIQKRGSIKGTVTVIKKWVDKLMQEIDSDETQAINREQIETRIEKLDEAWYDFQEVDNLVVLAGQPSQSEEFADKYFETKASLKRILSIRSLSVHSTNTRVKATNRTNVEGAFDRSSVMHSDIRLPRIQLEPFNGEYSKWQTFEDQFTDAFHNNDSLSQVAKLHYLKGYLKGEAANLIRHLPLCETSYIEAWSKLKERYDRKNYCMKELIQLFMNQSTVQLSSVKSLRSIYDTSDEVLRAIRAMGSNWESKDPWLIFILLSKLDLETQQAWAQEAKETENPTITQFLSFLDLRCRMFESCTVPKRHSQSTPKHSHVNNTRTQLYTSSIVDETCPICGDNHLLFRCKQFRNLETTARRDVVQKHHLCYNCLRPNHAVINCLSKARCYICQQTHHTLLHVRGKSSFDHIVTSSNQHKKDSSNNTTSSAVYCSTIDPPGNSSSTNGEVTNEMESTAMALEIGTPGISTPSSSSSIRKTIPRQLIPNQLHETSLSYFNSSTPKTLLSTITVLIVDGYGQRHKARALLDSGSQSTLISEGAVQRIGLQRTAATHIINTLGSTKAGYTRGCVNLRLMSIHNHENTITTKALILPRLTSKLPVASFDISKWPQLNELTLADPWVSSLNDIDMILGNDVFLKILLPEKIQLDANLIAQHTIFGWILGGTLESHTTYDTIQTFHTTTEPLESELQILEQFWKIDDIPNTLTQTENVHPCEKHFNDTTTRSSDGRYIVRLPFIKAPESLGYSLHNATRRLWSMERKFARNKEFATEYKRFLEEYHQLRHMELVPKDEINRHNFYLPHHAVVKEASTTTKLRVVYDGSCKASHGLSLNEILECGPTIQNDLATIICRFRNTKIAIVADIEKMYRQILVHRDDSDYQRIVWRDDPNQYMDHYRLLTVTYGTSCAPFLAVRTLHKVADDYKAEFPQASTILKRDFYVDDMMTGTNNIENARDIYHQMSNLLAKGGFTLRKWVSNSRELMQFIYPTNEPGSVVLFDDSLSVKTLGLMWCPTRDLFQFKVHLDDRTSHTKRSLLSEASRIFDPLGWLSPVIVIIKMMFQRLWIDKIQWDEVLPTKILADWSKLRSQLINLEDGEVPRCTIPRLADNNCSKQLHVFTDASEKAYGAVVYLRTGNQGRDICVRIVVAKSKVAPIKQMSLPRLELCAALVGSRLVKFVRNACPNDQFEVYGWTDSTIVLSWLTPSSRKRECFVANRITKILTEIPRTAWSHVPSSQNPADVVSRGLSPIALWKNELWWFEPEWLSKPSKHWPIQNRQEVELTPIIEQAIHIHHTTNLVHICDQLFTRFNNVRKITRILAYVWRYIQNLRNCIQFSKNSPLKDNQTLTSRKDTIHTVERLTSVRPLEVAELNWAERIYIKWAQLEFKQDIIDIQRTGHVSDSSKLLLLTPFLDEYGVLRVGGRLENASCAFEAKHPSILPKRHILSTYLIDEYHKRHFHAGSALMISMLRQRFWILDCRRLVRAYVIKCIICFKAKQHQNNQLMGNLPKFRVRASRPFQYTGVDYAGPVYMRSREGRGNVKVVKGYIALFICMVVKAVHIELVTDMSTTSFIAALRRFIARRGLPEEITSDNGTNFVGCKKELGELFKLFSNQEHNKLINEFLTPQKITFRFIPARSPHFGGLWEANIKSMKQHLNKAVGSTTLTYEQLYTVLTEIEALLNSRPLCANTEDLNDYDALTPGHFLIGAPLVSLPEPDLQQLKQSRLSMWQNLQVRVQSFWKRWSLDYLTTLQHRPKWKYERLNIEVGQLVLTLSRTHNYSRIQTGYSTDYITKWGTMKTDTLPLGHREPHSILIIGKRRQLLPSCFYLCFVCVGIYRQSVYTDVSYCRAIETSVYTDVSAKGLIREDNIPKSTWLLGRVIAVHKSPTDNLVRVATIKTLNGEYKRPIVKLVPLPLADEEHKQQMCDLAQSG